MSLAGEPWSPLRPEPIRAFLQRRGAASLLTRLLLPDATSVELSGLGRLDLRPSCLDMDAGAVIVESLTSACEAFPLGAPMVGALCVERSFARYLVGRLTGAPTLPVTAPLSRIERGLLAGVVAASLAKLDLVLGGQVTASGSWVSPRDATCVTVRVRLDGEEGRAWVCVDRLAVMTCVTMMQPPPAVRMELARTHLPKREALGASVGDIVVFDETRAIGSVSSCSLRLCCQGRQANAKLDPDGGIGLEDTAQADGRALEGDAAQSTEEVAVTAEVGRRSDDTAVDANPPSFCGDGILLSMDGLPWAEGTLSEIDGCLAVRIMRIAHQDRLRNPR